MSTPPAWLPSMPGRSRLIDWRTLDAISPARRRGGLIAFLARECLVSVHSVSK
jgi:hypothetical protein